MNAPPEFVAVDGEAVKDGRYVLMRSSLGHELFNPRGISTRQAFEFLLELQAPGRVICCYGLNYDVNQWIKDLSLPERRELWDTQQTAHAWTYRLRWWPRKYLYVRDVRSRRYVEVAEVLGYFQSTFVQALEDWGIGAPAEIAEMKDRRATFTMADLEAMRGYCLRECQLLVELMDALADAVYEAELAPRSPGSARAWIGAGSIASTLLGAHGVDEHHVHDTELASREVVESAVLGAMFGGRIEMLAGGIVPAAQTRDIRSAYPHAITQLPSLAGAKLKRRPGRAYRPGMTAIWRVAWDAGRNDVVPFPARKPDGTIWYVSTGAGCYHACEVDMAIKLGYQVTVFEGWELVGAGATENCFGFIAETYRKRAKLKSQGHAAEKALKLGLNSCYGKLAQGFGASGRLPRFQSYFWAGQITARTRARMLEAAARSRRPVMIATDGIFAAKAGARPAANPVLGTWEAGAVSSLFSVQPGVYHAYKEGSAEVRRSRGFRSREMDWSELREGFEAHGLEHVQVFESRRFIGLGVALLRGKPEVWRTWTTDGRSLSLWPDRKRVGERDGALYPLHPFLGPIASEPYTPKQDLYDDPTPAKIENMMADDQPDAGE